MLQKLWSPRMWIIYAGLAFGFIAAYLTNLGNPGNMGFCLACFYRDITGAVGLHQADAVQYLRPEIMGLVLGSLITALAFGEFRPRGGSSTLIRFVLGAFFMVGALVFLGCTTRAVLRLAGGDLNALLGIAGLVAGVLLGIFFIKRGFSLGRSVKKAPVAGWIMPAIMIGLIALLFASPGFINFSSEGPGSQAAAAGLALGAGLIIGFLGQRTRICFTGAWRDGFLVKDTYLFSGVAAFFIAALATNYITGNFGAEGIYSWGFADQPVAHSEHFWNFSSMVLAGLTATLLGGCPFRQTILVGEGDTDAVITVFGMIFGAAIAHNFLLASSPLGVTTGGMIAVAGGIAFCVIIGFLGRLKA